MTVKISGVRQRGGVSGPPTGGERPAVAATMNSAMTARPRRPVANPAIDRRRMRRSSGHRAFSVLSDEQMRICELIALGFHLRTSGLGMRTQSFTWQPPATGNPQDREMQIMQRFTRWAVRVRREGLPLSAILDIVVFGKSCRRVDRERQKRSGFAKDNLLKSLDFYRQA